MREFKDLEAGGFVSVWIGDGTDPAQLDDYLNLSRQFETDFGFPLSGRNMPETATAAAPTPIAELIRGFSWCERYQDAIVEEARKQGIQKAASVVIFFNFRYEPGTRQDEKIRLLRFLCAVAF